jgi:hypothetical protein
MKFTSLNNVFSASALTATTAVLASGFFSTPVLAQTVTGTTTVKVQVPKLIQLTTFNTIDITLTASQLGTGASGGLLVQTAGTTTGSTPLTTPPIGTGTTVAVPINPLYTVLTNAQNGANMTVAVATGGGTLTNTAVATDTMTMTVTAGGTATTPKTGPQGTPYTGSATLTFDLTNAKSDGSYRTGGSITITAINQ